MKIYPAIDLINKEAVRLYKGDYNIKTTYGTPLDMALEFESCGCEYLHVVDLDSAKSGSSNNNDVIRDIVRRTTLKVEVGGGIRSIEKIEEMLTLGVDRVILGSVALDKEFVKVAIEKFGPERIVVGLDCKNMMISTHGWLKDTNIDAVKYALELKEIGLKYVIFTDISKDGTLEGINVEQIKMMCDTGLLVTASGGARDISDVKKAISCGCDAIILGKSLYNKSINLKEALEYEV